MTETAVADSSESTGRNSLLFWGVMAVMLTLPSVATWVYFIVLSGSEAMGPVYSATKVIQFSLPALVTLFIFRERLRMFAGGTKGTLAGLAFGALTAFGILALYLGYLRNSPVFAGFEDRLGEKLEGFGATTPVGYTLLGVFICLFHSFLEEYYWRWFVFGELRKRISRVAAYVIAAVGFAAHHVLVVGAYLDWKNLPWIVFFSAGVAVGGLVWSWLYERTGSLFAPWLSHLLVDVALLVVGAFIFWG